MCIVSQPVKKMADTKLFVAKDSTGKRQLIVYSNKVDNLNKNNAMILPVPNPQSLKFDNLEKYPKFFDHCFNSFFIPNGTGTFSMGLSSNYNSKTLKVFSVGSYNVSVANNFDELKLVDKSVFEMDSGCFHTLEKYSMPIFGFIICQLKSGNHKYHPLAYSHDITNGQIFVPTKHYHGHVEEKVTDDWDHEIYFYNINKPSIPNNFMFNFNQYKWSGNDYIEKSHFDFNFGELKEFIKVRLEGLNFNQDIIINQVFQNQELNY